MFGWYWLRESIGDVDMLEVADSLLFSPLLCLDGYVGG